MWSEEWRSGDSHLEWPPRIMGFIHSRNVSHKEVITFSRPWEESTQDEARLIIREREDGRNWRSSSHDSKKIPQAMRNVKNSILEEPLIHINIWIRTDVFTNEEYNEAEGSRRSLPTKQIKIRKIAYNHLQAKKDETCSEEQVTTAQEIIQSE